MPVDTSIQLQLHLEPKEPIAVHELTGSLTALTRQYQSYVDDAFDLERPSQARLLVSSVQPGSIDIGFIPDLREAIAATAPFVGQLKVVSGFAEHISKLVNAFKKADGTPESAPDVTVRDCEDAVNIVKPIAEHGGSQTFNVYNGPVLQQNFTITAPEARAIVENASQIKGHLQFPEAERHQRVPLRWFRLEPIWKEVESLESVMIPCLAPDGQRGASCGSQTIAGQQIAGGCATTVT
jgi:hypothetical protein